MGSMITSIIMMLLAADQPRDIAAKALCSSPRIAFVQNRSSADLKIRFVSSNEDVRISFRKDADDPCECHIVGRSVAHDLDVYVESYAGDNILDVKVVDAV